MTKQEIKTINDQMKTMEDFTTVKTMLDIIGKLEGKVYGILNRKVVFLKEAHGHIEYHDAYVWAD